MKSRAQKIYASKKWLIDRSAEVAAQHYLDSTHIGNASQFLVNALCECAVADHRLGGGIFAKTSDGMEWIVTYRNIGKRNLKTGRIDKRLTRR